MTLEITGEPPHVDSVIARLEPLGIVEMVRTGQVAMRRGDTALSAAQYSPAERGSAGHFSTLQENAWRRCSTTRTRISADPPPQGGRDRLRLTGGTRTR